MRIESNPIARLLRIQGSTSPAGRPSAIAGSGGDSVELSRTAQSLRLAREALEAAPATREERVAQIKQALAEGSYSVTPEQVADKLLNQG